MPPTQSKSFQVSMYIIKLILDGGAAPQPNPALVEEPGPSMNITVFSAPEGMLAKVIGEKRARKLRELLDRRYEGRAGEESQAHLA